MKPRNRVSPAAELGVAVTATALLVQASVASLSRFTQISLCATVIVLAFTIGFWRRMACWYQLAYHQLWTRKVPKIAGVPAPSDDHSL